MRPVGVEQSNTSVVFGDELILKAYRRLEAGINPELELLRFLTEHGFAEHRRRSRLVRVLRAADRARRSASCSSSSPDAADGWELALDELRGDPSAFLDARCGGSAR